MVIRELNQPETEILTASAWILGVASQNNPVVQQQVPTQTIFFALASTELQEVHEKITETKHVIFLRSCSLEH